jgi:TonB family protein
MNAVAPAAIGNSSLRICDARTDPVLASEDESRALAALRFSLASDIVELVVLTTDEAFLQTLREGVGVARRLWHVLSSDKISDLLVAGGVGILVLDVQALNEAAGRFIADIKRQFPDLVVVVAGNRESETELARLISDGSIYRFIHKPLSPARARLFADAAVKRFDDRRRRTVGVAAPAAGAPHPPRRVLIGATSAGVAVLLAAGWLLHRRNVEPADLSAGTAPAQPAVPAAPAAGQPLPAVKSVLMEAQERLLTRARAALDQQRLDDAAAIIEAARKTGIATERVAQLATELAQSREAAKASPRAASASSASPAVTPPGTTPAITAPSVSAAAATAPATSTPSVSAPALGTSTVATRSATAPAAPTPPLGAPAIGTVPDATEAAALDLLKSARQSLATDRLVDPENDNAQYYLLALRKLDVQYAGLPALSDDLGARLVAKGLASLNAHEYDAARDWLDHAAAIGYVSPQADAARHDLDVALAHRAFMTDVITASQLTLVKSVQPQYPSKAEKGGIEGWVDLDFTVTDTGTVQDVAVDAAKPTGVFEAAATSALLQWRFKPLVRDGKTVATRARIRIRFAAGH